MSVIVFPSPSTGQIYSLGELTHQHLGQLLRQDPMPCTVILLPNLEVVGGTLAFVSLVGLDLGSEITAGMMNTKATLIQRRL